MTTKTNRHEVTAAQLDACTRVIDEAKHEVFYLVQSATDPTVTYQVRFNRQYHRLSCQCKGNQQGYTCWHLRAAYEAARQYAEAKRAEAQAVKSLEARELRHRVDAARPTHYSEAQIQADAKRFAPRPFSILK